MSLPRLVLTPQQLAERSLRLTGPELHHCRSLRLKVGEALLVTDGQGREVAATLVRWDRRFVEIELGAETGRNAESALSLTLYQGMARGSKLELVLQKATELGLSRFVPVVAARSQGAWAPGPHPQQRRWEEIVRQAARQCGRTRLPEVSPPLTFAASLEDLPAGGLGLILDEDSAAPALNATGLVGQAPKTVGLWVGPEGGFAPEELALARQRGLRTLGMGPRILRTETAGIVAVALAQFLWGDLG
ncbi:MAG: 16S rRNA (uracil(1498)-N(3))-methyltransferase [candidate division FCPU426 bacterium]